MSDTQIIVLTPVNNEAWILETFLAATSLWADHIIVCDQMSDDGSRNIAQNFSKVTLIDNTSTGFNEPERQKLLLNEARKFPGKKLLFALDADEFLSGNAFESPQWQDMVTSPPGTVFGFELPLITPTFDKYWISSPNTFFRLAYMDDGAAHTGKQIHSCRIPTPESAHVVTISDFCVMHYQFTDWDRMASKHRWYQCYERLHFPDKSPVDIFRTYNHMYQAHSRDMNEIPENWFLYYHAHDINVTSVRIDGTYRWDEEVLKWIAEYGIDRFWDIDIQQCQSPLLWYLRLTRRHQHNRVVRKIDSLLNRLFHTMRPLQP